MLADRSTNRNIGETAAKLSFRFLGVGDVSIWRLGGCECRGGKQQQSQASQHHFRYRFLTGPKIQITFSLLRLCQV
jgi:hypothetical protein